MLAFMLASLVKPGLQSVTVLIVKFNTVKPVLGKHAREML